MIYVLYGALALLAWLFLYKATQAADRYVSMRIHKRREMQFLRYVRVRMPDAKVVEAISVASSDKQALDNIERRLRYDSRHL